MGKFNLIETLRTEQELLMNKITKARENGDVGTYKNLITALREIVRLVRDEELYSRSDTSRLYFEAESDTVYIYFKDTVYRVTGDYKTISNYIDNDICKGDRSIKIHGDCHGFGLGLGDCLYDLGYEIKNTTLVISDFKNNKFSTRESIYRK